MRRKDIVAKQRLLRELDETCPLTSGKSDALYARLCNVDCPMRHQCDGIISRLEKMIGEIEDG